MDFRKVFPILLIALGAVLFVFSNYIDEQVSQGRGRISSAQRQVDQGQRLFSLNPVSKEVGKGFFGSAQKKIDKGSEQADSYARLSERLQIGGIILAVVGVFLFIFKKKRQ